MRLQLPLLALGLAVVLTAVGCGPTEKLLKKSGPTPAWVEGQPTDTDQDLLFKGLSLADNVLDERTARDRAMADARRQIASALETRVSSETIEYLEKQGYEARGQDRVVRAELRDLLQTSVGENVRLAREKDHYSEKWEVDEGLFSAAFVRYKYFVLVGYPRDEYERQKARFVRFETDRALAREHVRAGDPAKAVQLLQALVSDYPQAPVSLRLQLADALVATGRLDRAEEALDTALSGDLLNSDERRVRERLAEVQAAFPDVGGGKVYVLYDTVSDVPFAQARTLAAEVLAQAGMKLADMESGAVGALDAAGARRLLRLGVDRVVTVRLNKRPADPDRRYYDVVLHPAAAECVVQLYGADGAVFAAKTSPGNALLTDPGQAQVAAARQALHDALRSALITLAANGD